MIRLEYIIIKLISYQFDYIYVNLVKDSEGSGLSGDEEDYKEQIKKEKAKQRAPLSAK